MSHTLDLTDEQYEAILQAAASRGRTIQALVAEWIAGLYLGQAEPHHYETDDWLRHLGVSDEEIEASKRRVRDEAEMPYDADA
jgi:hypothetical protein